MSDVVDRASGAVPVVLDLFCGAGGAAVGYERAGFRVVGIDIEPQPNFPFPFIQADALEPPVELPAFDLIRASPPCQAHSAMSNRWRGKGTLADERVDLIPATRTMLEAAGVPYVIENVQGSSLKRAITLTGEMFGLDVHRPRLFDCKPFVMAPPKPRAGRHRFAIYGREPDGGLSWRRKDGSELRRPHGDEEVREAAEGMGIDWMGWDELTESIPPAYTEYIGRQMLETGVAA